MSNKKWSAMKTLAVSAGVALTALGAFGAPASTRMAHPAKSDAVKQTVHGTALAPKHELKGHQQAKTADTPSQEGTRQTKAPHGYDSVLLFPGEI